MNCRVIVWMLAVGLTCLLTLLLTALLAVGLTCLLTLLLTALLVVGLTCLLTLLLTALLAVLAGIIAVAADRRRRQNNKCQLTPPHRTHTVHTNSLFTQHLKPIALHNSINAHAHNVCR